MKHADFLAAFKKELRENIIRQIRMTRRSGTIRMSERNLLQITPTPKTNGALGFGANAQWTYRQIFHEVALTVPSKSFIDFSNDGRGQS
jgi:hypothetical protein